MRNSQELQSARKESDSSQKAASKKRPSHVLLKAEQLEVVRLSLKGESPD
ncbi:hypothetical protein [Microcoleus sp. D3_18a_C4]